MMRKIEYTDLPEKVYRALKDMILEGELAPGEKLRQEELSARLGVSRTPLAAAFSKLEKEMLVELLPRRGARVRILDMDQLLHIYDIRLRLEPLAAREAAESTDSGKKSELVRLLSEYKVCIDHGDEAKIRKADYEFHMAIASISPNEALRAILSSFGLLFLCNQRGLLKSAGTSLSEHEKLLAAICAGNGVEAERCMTSHLEDSRQHLSSIIMEAGE